MQFIHLSESIIINVEGETFTIESTDPRYFKLLDKILQNNLDLDSAKAILKLKFSPKINHAEIKEGQFYINQVPVPESLANFILSNQNEPVLFEYYYNFFFTLSKNNNFKEIEIWESLVKNNIRLKPFSVKESLILVLSHNIEESAYFKTATSIFTEDDLQSFIDQNFKKNLIKQLKNLVFKSKTLAWSNLCSNLSFLASFKENEDKFFATVEEIEGLYKGYQFIDLARHKNELILLLNSLQIYKLSQLKRFFNGWENFFEKLNLMHVLAREISTFQVFYNQEIFFQDYSKLTFSYYQEILNPKINEWRAKQKEVYSTIYFKLDQKHPWLLKLPRISTPDWGECSFLIPNQGLELDIWSNTMNHCIRGYKEQQAKSESMILLSIVNNQRWMIATLELDINYRYKDIKIRQFVGHANEQIKHTYPEFYQQISDKIIETFYYYVRSFEGESFHLKHDDN